jgi:hypothetical protein
MTPVPDPNPLLAPDAPLEVLAARTLFEGPSVRRRGFPSIVRLPGGRLLLAFMAGTGPELRDDAAVMLSHSDDNGETWDEPFPLYASPGWNSVPMGGLAQIDGDHIQLMLGRIKQDMTLAGDEPITDWFMAAIDSRDGGRTWSDVGPEISLFPTWTEMYGASNPHRLSDGRLLWAVIGTVGRDVEWQSGVTFSDANGAGFTSPVLIGAAADRNFADTDLVRLPDGRFLAVMREMITRQSHQAWSSDEGRTWTPIRPTCFRGSNTKLFPLRSGAVLCAYRDEDPARRGVSLSLTEDGGENWRSAGQLYAAPADARHLPGSVCGYPDIVSLGGDEIAAVLHSYPGPDGRMSIQFLRLRDRS